MPVDYNEVDRIATTIRDLYAEAELSLIKRISLYLAEGADAPDWAVKKLAQIGPLRSAAARIVTALGAEMADTIRKALVGLFRGGWSDALADVMRQVGGSGSRRLAEQVRKAGGAIPVGAVEALATTLVEDLRKAENGMIEQAAFALRSTVVKATARVLTGAQTQREAVQQAWTELAESGMWQFADKSGRNWHLPSYVDMATRTAAAHAAEQGHIDAIGAAGLRLIYIGDHAGECAMCRPWEGKILALSGPTGAIPMPHATTDQLVTVDITATLAQARAAGLHHPNCRHGLAAFLPGVTRLPEGRPDPEGEKARQKQRQLERAIRKAKLTEAAALDDGSRRAAKAMVRIGQAKLREHLDTHPELSRRRDREQIPKGVPPAAAPEGAMLRAEGGPLPQRRPQPQPEPEPDRPDRAAAAAAGDVPAAARPYHRNLDGIEDFVQTVVDGQPPLHREKLSGGYSATTELVTLADGTKVIRKTVSAGERGRAAAAEHAASLIGRALGLRAPRVYRDDERAVWMEYVDAPTVDVLLARAPDEQVHELRDQIETIYDGDDGRVLGLFDLLIGNGDRHPGNWILLVDEDVPVPIDHGNAFINVSDFGVLRANIYNLNSDFAVHYADRLHDHDLTWADIREVRRRLEALRPDFDHMGRGRWLDYSLAVLDKLLRGARGAINLIDGVR